MIYLVQKLAVFWVKTPILSPIFWRKCFKTHNNDPCFVDLPVDVEKSRLVSKRNSRW
jgi:hypothetical protein